MIARGKPAYNTIDKVTTRLDRVMKALEAMGRLVVVNVN